MAWRPFKRTSSGEGSHPHRVEAKWSQNRTWIPLPLLGSGVNPGAKSGGRGSGHRKFRFHQKIFSNLKKIFFLKKTFQHTFCAKYGIIMFRDLSTTPCDPTTSLVQNLGVATPNTSRIEAYAIRCLTINLTHSFYPWPAHLYKWFSRNSSRVVYKQWWLCMYIVGYMYAYYTIIKVAIGLLTCTLCWDLPHWFYQDFRYVQMQKPSHYRSQTYSRFLL